MALHRLLERQHYRVAHWQLAGSEINYRRFFDINSLAGLRVEDIETFRRVHALVARLIADDKLQGLRLDHIDGLWDPIQYSRRLQRLIRAAQGGSRRPLLCRGGEDSRRRRAHAGASGRRRHHRLRMAQRDLAGSGRRSRARAARSLSPRGDRQSATRSVRSWSARRRACWTICCRASSPSWRGCSRASPPATTAPAISPRARLEAALRLFIIEFPVYRTYITMPARRRRIAPPSSSAIAAARAHWFGAGRRDLRFPARRR